MKPEGLFHGPPLVSSTTISICANWPPSHRIRHGTPLAAPNLVPRAQPSGEPCKRREAGCLCNFGPKPNPFAAGRQVKNERCTAVAAKKKLPLSSVKRLDSV